MRILSISAQKPNLTGSGVYLTELAAGFGRQGHDNAVLAGTTLEDSVSLPEKTAFFPIRYQSEALPFPVLGMSDSMPYESTHYRDLTPRMQEQIEAQFVCRVAEAMEVWRPDVLVCHHLYFVTALIRERFPTLKITAVCHGSDLRQLQKTPLQRQRIRENIRNLDHIFALHDQQKREIVRLFDIAPGKVTVVGTGYNSRIFRPGPGASRGGRTEIIYAGKLCEKKGVLCLLNALDQLWEFEFTLRLAGEYSDPEEYARIVHRAEKANYPVEFLGRLSPPDLAEAFRRARLLVLPSLFEGLPLMMVEALACGLKVVATDLPGVRRWITSRVKNSQIEFVPPPVLNRTDEADAASLDRFQQDLTWGLLRAMRSLDTFVPPDTSGVSWDAVAEQVLAVLDTL